MYDMHSHLFVRWQIYIFFLVPDGYFNKFYVVDIHLIDN